MPKTVIVEFSVRQATQLRSYGFNLGDTGNITCSQETVRRLYGVCMEAEKLGEDEGRSPTFWRQHEEIIKKIDQANVATYISTPRARNRLNSSVF